jgi:multidrug resistance efflux pump
MNDTHTSDLPDGVTATDSDNTHPADALAGFDPADAPIAAERYAERLAAELEESGGVDSNPVQLQADLDQPGSSPGF